MFVLSPPRCGSSHLAELMHVAMECWAAPRENDAAWWKLFPYQDNGYTDWISVKRFRESCDDKALRQELVGSTIEQRGLHAPIYLARRRCGSATFLDKTIANAFHLEVLADVFPDARYVYLLRDGRAAVASMIEGWEAGGFMKRKLPLGTDSSIGYWTYPIPPGWDSIVTRPLPEICAWSWMQHHRFIRDGIERLGLRERTVTVRYEDLVAHREDTMSSLVTSLGSLWTAKKAKAARTVGESWTTVSSPRPDKWRETRKEEIEKILPLISDTMQELGYRL